MRHAVAAMFTLILMATVTYAGSSAWRLDAEIEKVAENKVYKPYNSKIYNCRVFSRKLKLIVKCYGDYTKIISGKQSYFRYEVDVEVKRGRYTEIWCYHPSKVPLTVARFMDKTHCVDIQKAVKNVLKQEVKK